MHSQLNIVVALRSEATPLIENFELKKQSNGAKQPIFQNASSSLVICVIRKENVIAGVNVLTKINDSAIPSAWLNVGICGHRNLKVGDGFIVNKIVDRETGYCLYPSINFDIACKFSKITTVTEPETRYLEDGGYDMESAAFFTSTSKISSLECIQCYKIVSDTPKQSIESISREMVSDLVTNQITEIERICDKLNKLIEQLSLRNIADELVTPFFNRWKFSVYQQYHLKRLLRKCFVLGIEAKADDLVLRNCMDSRSVIQTIQSRLESYWQNNKIE